MPAFLEQGLMFLGSAAMLLGVFSVYKNTTFSLAYSKSSGSNRRPQQDSDNALHRLWADAPEVVLGSNGFA